MDEAKFFEGVASYKLLAKKEVGQNFLVSPTAAKRIVDTLGVEDGSKVLEIGCGAGSLTFFLSQHGAEIDTIDIDEAMLAKLNGDFEGVANLHIKWGNAMKYDYSSYDFIIGNLPYYITSGIIENVLLGATKCKRAVFMVQKEAADRLLAKYGTSDYSPLSMLLNYVGKAKKQFNVQRDCFAPAPHVDSTVFSIEFDETKHNDIAKDMYKLANNMFLYRRKTIYNNLKSMLGNGEKAASILESCNIKPNMRPEQLKAEDYIAISTLLKTR